jgi:hypothetical protein
MDEINLPWNIEYARDLPVADTTEIKLTLSQLVRQLEKLMPTMLLHELPQWLDRFEKIEQGRMKYLISSREQAQILMTRHHFRLSNPDAAAMPASPDTLQFGLQLGIKPDQWQSLTLSDLQNRLHSYLRNIRNDVILASLDVLYVKTIVLVTVAEDEHEVTPQFNAMVRRAKQSVQSK